MIDIEQKYKIVIDRPIGYIDAFNNQYKINYGYIPLILGGDGEGQDVYIIDEIVPLGECEKYIIAIVHRNDDVETKWIGSSNKNISETEIWSKIYFIEQHFDSYIEMLNQSYTL
ncbi:inorganic pyrophosphatase [Mollicutes bacterium LVI A0039]|nr:inorganic pyrophosphatase [Mollicutes bacterium LVI A0039]